MFGIGSIFTTTSSEVELSAGAQGWSRPAGNHEMNHVVRQIGRCQRRHLSNWEVAYHVTTVCFCLRVPVPVEICQSNSAGVNNARWEFEYKNVNSDGDVTSTRISSVGIPTSNDHAQLPRIHIRTKFLSSEQVPFDCSPPNMCAQGAGRKDEEISIMYDFLKMASQLTL